jgi:opacity protein-like surface antigen
MKKSFLALAAAALLASTSMSKADPFAGLYIGATAGYNIAEIDASAASVSWNATGTAFGVHAGYNWKISGFVAGFEADLSFLNSKGDTLGVTASFDWMASARARLGMPFGNAMPYLTAGVAWAKGGLDFGALSSSATERGFVYGGGVDFALYPKTIARIEALHVDFGDVGDVAGVGLKADSTIIRAGVSFSLN